MKLIAKLFYKINPSLFSFFSGICVSLTLNIFTGILMDDTKNFSILNILFVIFLITSSGILVLESLINQSYIDTTTNSIKIGMSIEQICKSQKIKKVLMQLIIFLSIAIILIIGSLTLLYLDFN